MGKYKVIWPLFWILILLSGCEEIKSDKNGRPIQDFLNQNKITVSFENASIQNIGIKVENKKWHNIRILIPIGTILSPSNINYQEMLCYADIMVDLEGGEDKVIDIPVVCTNISKKVPEGGINYGFETHSTNIELNSFVERLSKADIDFNFNILGEYDDNYETLQDKYNQIQAAVWVITDDANYKELGILTRQIFEGSMFNPRLIYEEDAANAMILLNDCGIDIKSKKIWNDRFRIYDGIDEDEAKGAFERLINTLGD